MDSYKWLFNASRYPKIPSDYEKAFDPATNNHIAVVRKNKFYILETVQNGKQLTTAELEQQLDKIVQDAGEHRGPAIGVLTTDNRDKWTASREGLLAASPENAALLEKIESAILLVALDDSSPVTREEISRACWHGDGKNRFFDKSLQFIVFENAKAGFNGEHSSMDATPTARLSDFINHALFNNKINHAYDQPIRSELVTPKRLDFTVTPLVSRTIQEATQRFDEWVNKHELQVLSYQGFGKNFIKSCKVSPDAFAQMVIQLAYYNMHGVSRPTYESASTRKYLKGRTETIRSVSLESVDFVKSINDPSISNEVKIQKLQAACKAHSKYTVEASDGRGVDRHLLGLRLTLNANEPKPSIFTDPAYSYSSHWNLSTSQLVSEFFQGYGWGEVVPDGYGVPYMINNDSLLFTVTSLRPMKAAHLKHHLDAAATQMKQLFDNAQAPAGPKL
jgi:carnitine O-acetyltransferase